MNLGEILASGQERRKKLDQTLGETLNYYLGPTGIPQRLAALGVLNPVNDMEQASQKAKTVFSPDATGRERLDAGVGMVTDMATVLAPVAATNRVGGDATAAVVDSLLGIGQPTRQGLQDAGRRFAGDEAGNISFGASKADEIARLLREGRAEEITDDMMAALDPNDQMRLFKLYEDGATGVPMPMDEASRMARAAEGGFSTDASVYHATTSDFPAVDLGQAETGMSMGTGERAFWTTTKPKTADTYLPGAYVKAGNNGVPIGDGVERYYSPQSSIMPMLAKTDNIDLWQVNGGGYPTGGLSDDIAEAVAAGRDAVVFRNMRDPGIMGLGSGDRTNTSIATINPTAIRSRFARFDPRLKHLANLSAAGAGAVPLGALLANYDQDAEQRKLRDYLQQ